MLKMIPAVTMSDIRESVERCNTLFRVYFEDVFTTKDMVRLRSSQATSRTFGDLVILTLRDHRGENSFPFGRASPH